MPATLAEVRQAITANFPDADPARIEEVRGRINGVIKSGYFTGMDPFERNTLVTNVVRTPLGYRSLNIGILLPLAPDEQD